MSKQKKYWVKQREMDWFYPITLDNGTITGIEVAGLPLMKLSNKTKNKLIGDYWREEDESHFKIYYKYSKLFKQGAK